MSYVIVCIFNLFGFLLNSSCAVAVQMTVLPTGHRGHAFNPAYGMVLVVDAGL